ncbi:murein biosynthesis integral membrane protein MurJ [Pararhizobium haloflavum]|uniref:murein biosynthesis integral membrane protein MurJ n=1 Tax=Pararhizobium haloflavum TaxID=2037914 RepID=UPI000C1A38BD|nr:murein biosynthesis integral membrane protein MurJ [Pararhizobium haloflavum]
MSVLRKFATVGGATLASRVLGFVREALIAATLGAGPVADAFYAAFRFPNLFRRLFAEGAFNAAFVPLFAKELEGGGRAQARRFASEVASVLVAILILLSAVAMIFTPFLVGTVIAPKFADTPDKFELTVVLTRIMFPYLAAMSLVAMLSGVLNSFRRYFLAAIVPVLLNVAMIVALLCGLQLGFSAEYFGMALAVAVVTSGALQLALLIHGVHREGFSFGLRRPRATPAVKRLLWLALPAAITGGITQINLLIGQIIASGQDGAIAVMNYADRILQLPLGVIGIAIGVVLLPELARSLKAGDLADAALLQNRSLEFGLGLTVPAAVGFAIMPEPIVALLFERGAFLRETTEITAAVLRAFAIGLPAFVLIKIFQPGFYAREDMRTPMWFAGLGVIVNIAASLTLFPSFGVVGIGIATALFGWVNAVLLAMTLWRRDLFRPSRTTLNRIVLIALGSALMGVALFLAMRFLEPVLLDANILVRIGSVSGTIAAGAAVYFAFTLATGAIEKRHLLKIVRRR